MATFVLVPGAWCGGWVFQKLTPFPREAGHEVHTPTLTGLGEHAHLAGPDITLDTHIADVLGDEDLRDVVLVGWSYGGTVITGVADRAPERVAQLIYLDARVPEDGQSDYDIDPDGEAILVADIAQAAAAGNPGFAPVPVDGIRARVADPELQVWMLANLTPHPMATWTQAISLRNPAADSIPRV